MIDQMGQTMEQMGHRSLYPGTIKIPGRPVSMNSAYITNHRKRKVYMSEEYRAYKSRIMAHIPFIQVPENVLVCVLIVICDDWWCKNGNARVLDIQNMEKVIFDGLSERLLQKRDHLIWEYWIRKKESAWQGLLIKLYTNGRSGSVKPKELGSGTKGSGG